MYIYIYIYICLRGADTLLHRAEARLSSRTHRGDAEYDEDAGDEDAPLIPRH